MRTWLAYTEGADDEATRARRAPVLEYAGSDKFSALHFAARHGSVGVAALLLRAGADAFATDSYGRCPQHYALLYHHDAILEVMPPLDDEAIERLHLTRSALVGADDSDDDDSGLIYTFDMWDQWYEEHGWPTDGATAVAPAPAHQTSLL